MSKGWHPDLNPTQKKIFDSPANFVLGHGEKGSGKSIGFGHKIVRHCYENNNALALTIAPSIRTGNEGIWYDLHNMILPEWKEGMDLEYTESKLDPSTKDRHFWIRNRFNGWSKVLLMSIPNGSQVQDRVKGPAPSMVYIDELTNCNSINYFTYPAAQLGRRRGIHGPQQFTASCNPDGPSHWVYKVFFENCFDPDTGKRDPAFDVFHVPISENIHRLPEGYYQNLERILRSDPIERRRLIKGEWIDRPSGDALFVGLYDPALHVVGDERLGTGLSPISGYPIWVGYDLGQVHNAVVFMQCVPMEGGELFWIVFDEIFHYQTKIRYKNLAKEICSKMDYWNAKIDTEFRYRHISDSSAINQWRPGGEGSYDAWDLERFSGGRLKLTDCPKGEGSVGARVRALSDRFYDNTVKISDTCTAVKDSMVHLLSDPKKPGLPKRSKWLHIFDAMTYPMLYLEFPTYGQNGLRGPIPSVNFYSVK